jgi:predicted nucleotidyltransferase
VRRSRAASDRASVTKLLHQRLAAWAATKPSIAALHIFGSRARGDYRPDSDLDLAFEFADVDEELAELIENRAEWKRELSALTGFLVKDLYLRSDPEASGAVVTVFRRTESQP